MTSLEMGYSWKQLWRGPCQDFQGLNWQRGVQSYACVAVVMYSDVAQPHLLWLVRYE